MIWFYTVELTSLVYFNLILAIVAGAQQVYAGKRDLMDQKLEQHSRQKKIEAMKKEQTSTTCINVDSRNLK